MYGKPIAHPRAAAKHRAGCRKPASRTVIRRGAAFGHAHILASMLRCPKGRAPCLTARYLVFSTLIECRFARALHLYVSTSETPRNAGSRPEAPVLECRLARALLLL